MDLINFSSMDEMEQDLDDGSQLIRLLREMKDHDAVNNINIEIRDESFQGPHDNRTTISYPILNHLHSYTFCHPVHESSSRQSLTDSPMPISLLTPPMSGSPVPETRTGQQQQRKAKRKARKSKTPDGKKSKGISLIQTARTSVDDVIDDVVRESGNGYESLKSVIEQQVGSDSGMCDQEADSLSQNLEDHSYSFSYDESDTMLMPSVDLNHNLTSGQKTLISLLDDSSVLTDKLFEILFDFSQEHEWDDYSNERTIEAIMEFLTFDYEWSQSVDQLCDDVALGKRFTSCKRWYRGKGFKEDIPILTREMCEQTLAIVENRYNSSSRRSDSSSSNNVNRKSVEKRKTESIFEEQLL